MIKDKWYVNGGDHPMLKGLHGAMEKCRVGIRVLPDSHGSLMEGMPPDQHLVIAKGPPVR